MKLAIISAMWKRHKVVRLWAEAIGEAIQAAPYPVSVFVAGSEGQASEQIIKEAGFNYVEVANRPLSNKFNAAAAAAMATNPNYLLVLGSDNIICPRYLHHFHNAMKTGAHLIGHLDSYVIDLFSDRGRYFAGYKNHRQGEPVGSGRFIHANLVKALGGKPWPDGYNMSLDAGMLWRIEGKARAWPENGGKPKPRIKHKRKTFSLDRCNVLHVGMKSAGDKNPYAGFGPMPGRVINRRVLLARHFSDNICKKIENFRLENPAR